MSTRRARGVGALAAAAVLTAIVAALMAGGAGAGHSSALALPREQTLYMSGNQWSPNTDLNPAKNWDYVTGLVGFVYETPFRYDPLEDKFIPWLATSGKWTSKTTYSMTIRKGVKWSDGQTMTPQDVKYSFDLAQDPDASAAPALGRHRPEEHQGVGQRTSSSRSPATPATSSSTSTATTSRSSRSTSSRATEDRDRDRQPRATRRSSSAPARTCTSRASAQRRDGRLEEAQRLVGDVGARHERRADVRRRHQERHERRRAVQPARRATSTCSTTSRRSPRSRASSRRTSDRLRTTSARTRRGSSRTRRRSRSTTRSSAARWPTRSTWTRSSRQGLPGPRQQGEPDGPAADLGQVGRQEGRQAVRLLVQPRQGEGDPRRGRLQGHERRRVRREQGRLADRPQDRLPERVVRLDDRRSR